MGWLSDQHIVNTASLDCRSGEMRAGTLCRMSWLVSSLLMPGAWVLVMVAHWRWRWYRADTAQPAQPSPAEDGDMQHTATADNLILGTLRYL